MFVTKRAARNSVGGTAAGVGSRIADNGGDGVLIGIDPETGFTVPAGTNNSVEGNSIFADAGRHIDLRPNDGPTPNDPNTGANYRLNTPVLTSAILSGTSLFLTGFINAEANKVLRVEFIASATGGQGQTFLGFQNVSTGPKNTVVFTTALSFPAALLAEQSLTATVTDELGNTSEISLPLAIQ